MRKILWLLLLLVGLGGSASAQSYEKIQLYCEKGGETVTTDGRTSTTRVQRSYPSCTVTVYDGGTLTLASIASDSIGTPKSNPFTADSDGYISFYATDGTYDVKMSGSGLATPITRSGFWVITSGGGGGGISGSGTTNRFPIFTSSTAIGNSVFQQVGTSEFAPAATGKRINLGTGSQQVVEIANASVTGTTQNRIAKLTGAPSTAVIATTTDTTKLVGIVIAGAGTTGNAQIVTNGNVSCEFDGATTAGNYVGASTTTNGKCTDLGATLPVSGVQVIGRVLQTIGSAGNADVFIFTGEQGRGGVSGSGTTAYLSYWTSSSAIGATNAFYDTGTNSYTFGGNVDVANLGNSQFTIETDQVIFNGGVSRANNAIMQTMKATATQTGDFQRFTTSAGAARFRVDIDGDVLPRGVNYTWPSSLPASTGCLQITSAGVMSVVSCVSGTGVRYALNVKQSPYNCVGDGVTDDTTCFQDAIDDAALVGGYMVYAPAATYKVTGLSVPGGVTLEGDGMQKTIIYSVTNATIVNAVEGSGSYAFLGPTIRNLRIKGDKSAGTSQIALRADDLVGPDLYYAQGVFENIQISTAGSYGLYVGNVFSSRFVNIYSDDNASYPFYINSANMPSNHYESLYAQGLNSGGNAGFRVAAGNFICISCNGINASAAGSYNAIIGSKIGVDGATSNISAYAQWINCNFESALAGGIYHYYNSRSDFSGHNQFAGDGSASGSYKALVYEVDTGVYPPYFIKGRIDDNTVFASSPAAFYANSSPIWSNDVPPLTIDGQGPKIAGGAFQTTYYNSTNARSESLYRSDAYTPVTTVTTSTSFTNPGNTYYEVTCGSNCTLTLPWPGWYQPAGQPVVVKNLSTTGIVVTLAANSGGSVNTPNGYTLTEKYQSVTLMPDATALDWRVIAKTSVGVATRLPFYSDTANTTTDSDLTFDGFNLVSGRFQFSGGTAGAPAIASSGDTDTGWYSSAANRMGFAANGADVLSAGTDGLRLGVASSVTGALNLAHASSSFITTITAGNAAASRTYTWPTNFGAAGAVLTDAAGNGTLSWAVPTASASLTSTYVGYGNGSNVLTGTSDLAYNTTTKTLTITSAASGVIDLATTSTNSAFKLNGATHPGTAGGLILPFVGGGNGDAPGLWWTSSASYATTSGLFLSNGFNFQGASGTHDNLKINQGTASSSTGTTRYTFAPSSSLFTQNLSTGFTGSTHDAMQTDLISSGGAGGANFGVGHLFRLENASSSLADATRLAVRWTTATGGAETARFVVGNNSAGGGISDSFTVEADQYYGTVNALGNKSGSFTIDFNDGNYVTATATGNWTTVTFSNIKPGATYRIRVTQDGTGGKTWTPPTNFKYPGGVSGNILTGTANAVDVFICETFDSTNRWCNGLFGVKNP